MTWLKDNFWIFPLALVNVLIRCYGIADPWMRGHRGFSGALSGIVARNYLRYGLIETRAAPVWATGSLSPTEIVRHFHLRHPSLRYLLTAVFCGQFGVTEWAIRLLPILASLGSAVVLYLFVSRIWGKWPAVLAVAFLNLIPIDAYYGSMSAYEPIGMFFALLALLFYSRWFEEQGKGALVGTVVSLGFAVFSDYPGEYMVFLIGLHYLLLGPSGRRKIIFTTALWAYGVLLVGIWVGYAGLVSGSMSTFLSGLKLRAGVAEEARFTFAAYYALQYGRVRDFFTPVLRLLAIVWGVFFLIDLRRRDRLLKHSWVLLLLAYGMANLIVFRQGSWVHDYWLFFLSPFFAVSSAVAVRCLSRRLLGGRKLLVAALLILIWAWYIPSALAQLQTFYRPRDLAEVPLAHYLNAHTSFDEGVLLGFRTLYPHFDYYLDRRAESFDSPGEFDRMSKDERYRWCVLRGPRTLDEDLVRDLVRKHPATAFQEYLIFDLRGAGEGVLRQAADPAREINEELAPGIELIGYDGPQHVRLPDSDNTISLWDYVHSTSYDVDPTDEHVEFVLYWRAGEGIGNDLHPSLRLVGDDGAKRRVIEAEYAAVTDLYTTGLWQPEDVIAAPYVFELGEDCTAGVYTLEVGDVGPTFSMGSVVTERGQTPAGSVDRPRLGEDVEMPLKDGAVLVGFDTDQDVYNCGESLRLRVVWQFETESEPHSVSACLRNGEYVLCRPMGVIGGPDRQAGLYYEQEVELPLHPSLLGASYELSLWIGPEPGEEIDLGSVEILDRKQTWPLARQGMADWEGDAVLTPGEELAVSYLLDDGAPVQLAVDWTGRTELERTRVDAYLVRVDGPDDYLGTRVVSSGEPSRSEWVIPSALANPGENVVLLRVAPEPEGVHRMGWRGVVDQLFPDLLDEVTDSWSGALQVDLLQVSRDWVDVWDAYEDLMSVYAERGMWKEAATVYQEATAHDVRPEHVSDLSLLRQIARQGEDDWVQSRLIEEEERLIPNRLGIDFGGKIRLEGYAFQRRGDRVIGHLYFRSLARTEEDWTMWLHGIAGDEALLTGEDRDAGYVVMDTRLNTSQWETGDLYEVVVSRHMPEGHHDMRLGLWRWEDGSRLWRDDLPGEHEIDLGSID